MKLLIGMVPRVGGPLSGFVELLWPQGSSAADNNFQAIVEEEIYGLVKSQLGGLCRT